MENARTKKPYTAYEGNTPMPKVHVYKDFDSGYGIFSLTCFGWPSYTPGESSGIIDRELNAPLPEGSAYHGGIRAEGLSGVELKGQRFGGVWDRPKKRFESCWVYVLLANFRPVKVCGPKFDEGSSTVYNLNPSVLGYDYNTKNPRDVLHHVFNDLRRVLRQFDFIFGEMFVQVNGAKQHEIGPNSIKLIVPAVRARSKYTHPNPTRHAPEN